MMTAEEKQLFRDRTSELIAGVTGPRKDTVFAMMQPSVAVCDPDAPSVTLTYPGQAWEQNSTGVIHGGVTAAMMDVAMGTLTYALTGSITPTVNLNISFPRPAAGFSRFFIRAELTKAGRTVMYTTAVMYEAEAPDKPVATAQGAFFNPTGEYLGAEN